MMEPEKKHEKIIEKLNGYIVGQLKQPNRKLDADQKLISSGLVDSMGLVDLGVFVEETFGVRLDDTELNAENFDTLEELANIISTRSG